MNWFEYFMLFSILPNGLLLFSMYRNHWVFKVRVEVLQSDINEFKKLVSYHEMYWKIWIWDINKFKKKKL